MYSGFNVIIVAGGIGNRMQSAIPKQFLEIHHKPVIVHTLSKFLEVSEDIFFSIATPKEHLGTMENIINDHFPGKNINICEGGKTRFHSVKNALRYCYSDYIMIHDAVRPCIDSTWLKRIMDFTIDKKSAVPYINMNDSIRQSIDGRYSTVNRDDFIRIQTPQCFESSALKIAFDQEYTEKFTDDATVWESIGHDLHFFKGLERNIKITTPDDILLAANFLK